MGDAPSRFHAPDDVAGTPNRVATGLVGFYRSAAWKQVAVGTAQHSEPAVQ
jgi:hypothetical protein